MSQRPAEKRAVATGGADAPCAAAGACDYPSKEERKEKRKLVEGVEVGERRRASHDDRA